MAATSPEKVEQRLTVESTIQITDEIVAQKDREIAELRTAAVASEQQHRQQWPSAPPRSPRISTAMS